MKKIAILGLHLNYGGVEQTIINQANMLSKDYEVELVVTYKIAEKPAFEVNDNVKIVYLTNKKPNREEFKSYIQNKKLLRAFKEGIEAINIIHQKKKTMRDYIKNSDADIIISSRIEIAEILSKYKPKNTITITEEHCHHNNKKKYIKRLKKACKNIDYLVPVSKELTEFYKKEIKTTETVYIPNCINNWTEKSSKLNNKNLISVGRLSPEKGYLDLVDVFKKIYDQDNSFHLDIIGDGVEYNKIKNKIKELKLTENITLWGFKNSDFINKKLAESSLYLMCSYEESFGIVLIEAGALGVPSIAFDSASGAREIITNKKNGYIIPNRDKEEMANQVIKVINNPKELELLGSNAKEKAKDFTFEKVKEEWFDFINKIIKEKKTKRLSKYFDKLYNKNCKEFYKKVEKNLKDEKRMFIVTANPETFTYGEKDDNFNKLLVDENTTLIPDGIGIVKAANILKYNVEERITGVDLAIELLELANKNNSSLAILGATSEVINKLNKVLKEKYPNIKILKMENGYIENKNAFFESIAKLSPDICLVALGIPKQEELIYKHLDKFKKGIFVGVGGSLDVISGAKKRAPKIFIKTNTEWLYRIVKEPKRLKRFYDNNIKFIMKINKLKKNKNNNIKYYTMLFMFYFLIAVINQYFTYRLNINSYLNFKMLYFCAFWTYTFLIIRILLPNKIGKYSTLLFQIILIMITIVNYFYIGYFDTIFSWRDLILSGEGLSFISSIFPLITIKIVLTVILLVSLIIFTTKYSPNKSLKIFQSKKSILLVLITSIILSIGYIKIDNSLKDNSEIFNDNRTNLVLQNKKITYTDWNNGQEALKICGIYQYLIRDLYLTFFVNDNPMAAKRYLNEVLPKYQNIIENKNDYYGMFKNKNLILVMMESADDWQINEKSTPTIYKMKNEGIDFINHYSPNYVTGKTAQSEFMANSGIYPKFNSILPHYGYVDNNYKYSLPNLFKEKGYTVNAFHRTVGAVYNREKMMVSLGYENYYTIYAMQLTESEYDLDRYFAIKGYNAMTRQENGKPFMSFYITFSNHSPYTLSKKECSLHYEEIKKLFPNEKNEEKLCGYAQMRETDLFFELLLNKLEEDNLLKDTVIIAFSDHSNGMFMSEEENDKLNKTEMFIYNPELKPQKITNLTSTINILPMINNLFALESPYFMASYDPLTSKESYILFSDYTYYNGNEIMPITEEYMKKITISKNILISDYYN